MAAANEGFEEDPLIGGGFSRLLDSDDVLGLNGVESFIYPSSFSTEDPPKMLCFGDIYNQGGKGFADHGLVAQKSGITGSDSSSASSSKSTSSSSFSKSKKSQSGEAKTEQKKRNGSGPGSVPASSLGSEVLNGSGETHKKPKTENPTSAAPVKVRKEKVGDRITALQQLVSPYGKTDTASVLHEAMGYIRFLHDQVQVLSSPYLQRLPSSGSLHDDGGESEADESRYNLRSRGLCLVPVACTVHVANSNGADFWSPATGGNSSRH